MKEPIDNPRQYIGSPDELAELAAQLQLLGWRGLMRASDEGLIRFFTIGSSKFWVVVDPANRVAECRLLSGPPLLDEAGGEWVGGASGNLAWPIGAEQIGGRQHVALAYGVEDLLSANVFYHGIDIARTGMLCEGPIAADALEFFRGKVVTLLNLGDPGSQPAFIQWHRQLSGVAATVQRIKMLGWDIDDDGNRSTTMHQYCRVNFGSGLKMLKALRGDGPQQH